MNKPECIGFIMDGNRRWAKEHGFEAVEGHKQGYQAFLSCVRWLKEEQIDHGVFYAFSTENWRRTEAEVAYLMKLFAGLAEEVQKYSDEEGVRIRVIGRRSDFSEELQEIMRSLEKETAAMIGTTVWVALSYGGRTEIVEAVNEAIRLGQKVDEESFSKLLYTTEMPDPDIIVRTSGEHRLSNFLPWQSVYSELYFIEKNWPALTEADFKDILDVYAKRKRRHGA